MFGDSEMIRFYRKISLFNVKNITYCPKRSEYWDFPAVLEINKHEKYLLVQLQKEEDNILNEMWREIKNCTI